MSQPPPLPTDRPEVPPELEDRAADVEFRCANCAADMTWDPEADALACAHCGGTQPVEGDDTPILEYSFEEAGQAVRGYGVELRASRCDNCGARVAFDDAAIATACVFCGSSNVLAEEAKRNAIRPESIIPLDLSRADVEKAFRKWIGGLWFRPNALKQLEKFDAAGVYLPYWTYDCNVHSDWTAQAGYYYYVTETYTTMVNGKMQVRTRQVRKTRWVPAAGDRDDSYDDVHVLASHGVSRELAEELGDFDTRQLVPYRPAYLAGWVAEEYRVDLEDGWALARDDVVGSQNGRCAGDIPGDTYRYLRVRNRFFDIRWKHALLPMWSLRFSYKGETYPVLIHGQTGRVVGKAPISWLKIVGTVLGVLAAIGVAIVLAGLFSQGIS